MCNYSTEGSTKSGTFPRELCQMLLSRDEPCSSRLGIYELIFHLRQKARNLFPHKVER